MGITHAKVIEPGDRGLSEDWNAEHVLSDDIKPKTQATRIIAAYNSVDKTRADYVCNGINDDVEIQAALDSLPAQGGSVYLKEGDYAISATIVIPKADVRIFGAGANSNIAWSTNIPCFTTTFSGLVLDSISLTGPGKSNLQAHGLDVNGASNVTVHKCEIIKCRYGVYIHTASAGNFIKNNFINDCHNGVHLNNGLKTVINSNQFYVGTTAIYLANHSTNNLISGNAINGFSDYGINVNHSWDVVVSSNTIYLCVQGAVVVDNYSEKVIISNNAITQIISHGIILYRTFNSVVNANTIYLSENLSGIFVSSSDNNSITSNVSFGNHQYGIDVDGASDETIIVGNNCHSNTIAGIRNLGTNTEVAHNIT